MNNKVCPVIISGGLDNLFRRILQNPEKILKQYIKSGMTVLDFGCGPGFFTIEIAKLLMGDGKVIAADLQSGMLDKIKRKIKGIDLEEIIVLHKCEQDNIGINEKIDFILLFWMLHEVSDSMSLINEFVELLNDNGRILIVEPKIHVPKKAFNEMVEEIREGKIKTEEGPKIFFSRTIVLKK
jgi:ubiquinone/menaquinone biosynthesis C-methylase UbiE